VNRPARHGRTAMQVQELACQTVGPAGLMRSRCRTRLSVARAAAAMRIGGPRPFGAGHLFANRAQSCLEY
jgi:hypothetical protein